MQLIIGSKFEAAPFKSFFLILKYLLDFLKLCFKDSFYFTLLLVSRYCSMKI